MPLHVNEKNIWNVLAGLLMTKAGCSCTQWRNHERDRLVAALARLIMAKSGFVSVQSELHCWITARLDFCVAAWIKNDIASISSVPDNRMCMLIMKLGDSQEGIKVHCMQAFICLICTDERYNLSPFRESKSFDNLITCFRWWFFFAMVGRELGLLCRRRRRACDVCLCCNFVR